MSGSVILTEEKTPNCEGFTAFFRNSQCYSIGRATWLRTLRPQDPFGLSRALWSFSSKEM